MMNYQPSDHYWVVGSDRARVFSSARMALVPIEDGAYQIWREAGGIVTTIASLDELVAVLRAANVPPYHCVSPYRIVRRLEAAGLAAQALAIIDAPQNAVLKARFYTLAGAGGIPADDPDAIALVVAAGGDPAAILAPES